MFFFIIINSIIELIILFILKTYNIKTKHPKAIITTINIISNKNLLTHLSKTTKLAGIIWSYAPNLGPI